MATHTSEFNFDLLKEAINTLDKDSCFEMLKFLAKDLYDVKVEDISDQYSLNKCKSCRLGTFIENHGDHLNIGQIKIYDQFNSLEIEVCSDNLDDYMKLQSDDDVSIEPENIDFLEDCVYVYSGSFSIDMFKIGEAKMKKVRQEIIKIIKSWNIECVRTDNKKPNYLFSSFQN